MIKRNQLIRIAHSNPGYQPALLHAIERGLEFRNAEELTAWVKEAVRGKAQVALMGVLENYAPGQSEMLTDLVRGPRYRMIHFKSFVSAAHALAKQGLIEFDGAKVTKLAGVRTAAHHVAPDGAVYVDTAFLNSVGKVRGVTLQHMGFGEFYADTPKGRVDFDRMRGKDFPGQSGRSHKLYGARGAPEWLVEQMERAGGSEKMAAGKKACGEYMAEEACGGMMAEEACGEMMAEEACGPMVGEADDWTGYLTQDALAESDAGMMLSDGPDLVMAYLNPDDGSGLADEDAPFRTASAQAPSVGETCPPNPPVGLRVQFANTLEAMMSYPDAPEPGTKGTIIEGRTDGRVATNFEGRVFVEFNKHKTMAVVASHLLVVEPEAQKSKLAKTASARRYASMDALLADIADDFVKVAEDTLVHRATKDLWSLKQDPGGYVLERLFDDNGDPLKLG